MKTPQNIESEQQVLGGILSQGNSIQEVIEFLHTEDFYQTRHQTIYQVMLDCYDKNIPIDIQTLLNELKERSKLDEIGGLIYLLTLSEIGIGGAATGYHSQKIIESRHKRYILRSIVEISKELDRPLNEIKKNIDMKLLDQVMGGENKKGHFLSIGERLNEMKKQAEWYWNNQGRNVGLTIGFPKLMEYCPILPKDYILLAGASKLGKTIFALNLAFNIARAEKKHTAFLTCELSREEIELRLKSLWSGFSTGDIMRGRIHPDELNLEKLGEIPFFIAEFGCTTVDQIRNGLRLLKKKCPDLCFVAIDAINFISDKRGESRAQELTDISGKLRDLAQTLDIAILLICQIPKAIAGGRPRLENIKDSGSLGYDADIVWFLFWDIDKFIKEQIGKKVEKSEIDVELIIEKQRRGSWGRDYKMVFIPRQMYFGEKEILDGY